ncbi:MAG: DUF2868 domain-containing protein, partial [Acidobacteriota bacterium]|nr:DUF2868 domain-containing protein [Acidobacteriota bacterium]
RRLQRWKLSHDGNPRRREIVTRAVIRFAALWHRLAGDLLSARVRELLHWSVVFLAIGICLDLQIRGSDSGARISWHGSWLEVGHAHVFLETVLAPASWITRLPVPDLAAVSAPGDVGRWVLLLSVTLALFVILPRTLLAIGERLRSRRLAAGLGVDTDDGYYRRAFVEWRGDSSRAVIHPFGYRPPPPTIPSVNAVLYDLLGARAAIQCAEPVDSTRFQTMIHELRSAGDERRRTRVVLFNLSQDPHPEIHGRFLIDLKQRLEQTGERLLVLVDPAHALQTRTPSRERKRRMEIWRSVIAGTGLETEELNVGRPTGDDWLGRVAKNAWLPASNP